MTDRMEKWLRDNAHFGRVKLGRALGISSRYVSELMAEIGVKIADAKRAKGLSRIDIAEGEPPPPPPAEKGAHSKKAAEALPDDPDERDAAAREASLRTTISRLSKEKGTLLAQVGHQLEDLDAVLDAVRELPAVSPFNPVAPAVHKKKPEATACLGLADWHYGEVVDPHATGGWGAYSGAILKERLDRLLSKFVTTIDTLRAGYSIPRLVVQYLGDMVSGDIHEEFISTNEAPLGKMSVDAGALLAWFLRELCRHFDEIRVEILTTGNHGRTTAKPKYKQAGLDNWEYVSASVAKIALAGQDNITVNIHEDPRPKVIIHGHPCLLEHGDAYRSWMSIPHYGIERGSNREAFKRMVELARHWEEQVDLLKASYGPFRYLFMGHHHVAAKLQDGVVRLVGSPKGLCEYAHKRHFYSTPSQTAWLFGRHGIFHETDFDLDEVA